MNTLFRVVNFLKYVATEVVLLSIVAFKTLDISQGSVATHLTFSIVAINVFWPKLIFG